jgi:hypothetical protein
MDAGGRPPAVQGAFLSALGIERLRQYRSRRNSNGGGQKIILVGHAGEYLHRTDRPFRVSVV